MKPKKLKLLIPGFVPSFQQNIQGHLKDFQGHISHFSRTTFRGKRALSLSFFSSSTSGEFYPDGLSVCSLFFAVLINLLR